MALFKMRGFPKYDFKSEKPENKTNYNKAMDLNEERYGPSAGQTIASSKFKFTQEDRPSPTYEGTDEYRSEKNISTKEKSKRGVLQKGWHGAKGKPNINLMAGTGGKGKPNINLMAGTGEVDLRKKSGKGPRA